MEKIIETFQEESCPLAWLIAVEYLFFKCNKRERYNLSLAIESPERMNKSDRLIVDAVDAFLVSNEQDPILTVAGTIFPANHYLRNGKDGVYEGFPEDYAQLGSNSGWGTYAMRMLVREGKDGKINPLMELVEKIKKFKKLNRSAYEINFIDSDILELPIYCGIRDYKRHIPQPCLSHLTFKIYPNNKLMLTAVYRSHFYTTKALGNFIGLAQLQSFVAAETGLAMGPLVCHSTHARVDSGNGVKITDIKKLITELKNL